jgi:hypothetical protein
MRLADLGATIGVPTAELMRMDAGLVNDLLTVHEAGQQDGG